MGTYTEELLGHMTQTGTGSPRFSGGWCSNDSGREVYCGSWDALVDMTSNGRGWICTQNGGATGIVGWVWVDLGANHSGNNSKLQAKDYETWVLRKSTGKWERLWRSTLGVASCWDSSGNRGAAINGSYSAAVPEGNGIATPNRSDLAQFGLEFWPTGTTSNNVDAGVVNTGLIQDCRAIHIRCLFRVALIDSQATDDRSSARFRCKQGWDFTNRNADGWSGGGPENFRFTRPEMIDRAIAVGDYTRSYPGHHMDGGQGRWVEIPFSASDPDRWYVVSGSAVQCAQITGFYGPWARAAGVNPYTGQTPYGRDAPYVLTASEFRANPPPDPDTGGSTTSIATRIMPLGDSLTAGAESSATGYRTYRGALQTLLTSNGAVYDIVGTQVLQSASGGSDADHEGYPGAGIDSQIGSNNIRDRLSTILASSVGVDVIVLWLGWNDVYNSSANIGTRYASLVSAITAAKPSAKVLICTLHPQQGQTEAQTNAALAPYATLNAAIRALDTGSGNVRKCELAQGSFVSGDYWDVIHLKQAGADKVAAIIYARLVALGWVTVTGSPPVDPPTPEGGLSTQLSWITAAAGLSWFSTSSSAAASIVTASLPDATISTAYSATIVATGTPAPTFAVQSGTLPTGLALNANTGVISGTPTVAASSTFTIRATNSGGTSDATYTVTVTASPVISTTSLPNATVGTAYSATLTAAGSTPISWSVQSGALPVGLSLSGAAITGTPSSPGVSTFTVRATNSAGSATATLSITTQASIDITTASLADFAVGVSVSQQLQASGAPPITWSVPLQQLPAGLSLSSAGLLSGTPTTASTGSMTVTASNSAGSDSQVLSWSVVSVPAAPIITTTSVASGTVGTAYSRALSATGTAPITWSLADDSAQTVPDRASRIAARYADWSARYATTYASTYVASQGTVFYIDPSRNVNGSGTFASPYNALPALTTGNTYLIREGTTLSGQVTISTANVLIGTYASADGSRVIDKTRLAIVDMTTNQFGLLLQAASITISGIKIVQTGVYASGGARSHVRGIYGTVDNITIEHCWLDDIGPSASSDIDWSAGIYINGSNCVVRCNTTSNTVGDNVYLGYTGSAAGPAGARVYANEIIVPAGITTDGPDCVQLSSSTSGVGAVEIYDNWLEHRSNCKQCVVHSGTSLVADSMLVKRNYLIGPNQNVAEPVGATQGKSIITSCYNSRVEGNYIESGDWTCDLSAENCAFVGNVAVFDATGQTFEMGTIAQSSNCTIRNNTFVVLAGTVTNAIQVTGVGLSGISITDNVIVELGGTLQWGIRYRTGTSTEARNIVYGATLSFVDNTGSAVSAGTGSSVADPKLSATFAPRADSPALSGGAVASPSFVDIDGTSSTSAAIRGAYQHIASTGASTLPAGLSISSAGVIGGTPAAAGTTQTTVRATNAYGSDDQVLTITIAAAPAPADPNTSSPWARWITR